MFVLHIFLGNVQVYIDEEKQQQGIYLDIPRTNDSRKAMDPPFMHEATK